MTFAAMSPYTSSMKSADAWVRAPGCLDVAITADQCWIRRAVNTFERWQSEEDLDVWRAVADAPDTEITIGHADVMMYVVSDVRPPFS